MALVEEQKSLRKSLLATTAIAVVFSASNNSGINWIVNLSGLQAWLFLLLAHLYFTFMWILWRLAYDFSGDQSDGKMPTKSVGPQTVFRILERVKVQSWMMRRFTDICALVGFLVIAYKLVEIIWLAPTTSIPTIVGPHF